MSNIPYPITAESTEELRSQLYELIRQLYEDKIGGLDLGDVFSDDGGIFALNIADLGGLERSNNELQVKCKSDGGIDTASSGTLVKCKPFGGLDTDADGIFVESAGNAGAIDGMQVTVKDADELYVWGGHIEINGLMYQANAQITVDASGLDADTLYYLYVAAASGTTLAAGDFSLSTTAPTYDHTKGAYYKTGDATKRWLANVKTAA